MATRTGEPDWWPASDGPSVKSSPAAGGCRRCGFLAAQELCSWCAEEDDPRGGTEAGLHRGSTPTPTPTTAMGGGLPYGPLRRPEPSSGDAPDPPVRRNVDRDSTHRRPFPLRRLSWIAAATAIAGSVGVGFATTSGPPGGQTVGDPGPIPTVLVIPTFIVVAPTSAPAAPLTPASVALPTSAVATSPRASTVPSPTASAPPPEIAADETLLTPVGCPIPSGLKSQVGNETRITFYNERTDAITVQWIDYDGNLQTYATIAPHEQLVQITYVTHLWLVSNAQRACLRMYEATAVAGAAVIR